MNDKIIRRLVALFTVVAAVLVAVAVVAVRNIGRDQAAGDWVNHTHETILQLGEIRAAFQVSDAALRTLAFAGGEQDEAACREARSHLEEHIEVVKALTRNDPAQARPMRRLEELTLARTSLSDKVLAARSQGQTETVRALLAAQAGSGVLAEVQRLVDKMKLDQMALLASRDGLASQQAQTTRWTVWAGVGLNFGLLALTAWLVVNDITIRRRAAADLQEANARLDTRVRERTAELSAANQHLTAENLERRWGAQALEHQLRYNELIVNSISDMVLVLTKAQNISRTNPAVAHVTGWEPVQVINRPLFGFVRLLEAPSHFSAGIVDPVAQALKEGRDLRDLPAVITDRMSRDIAVRFTLFPLRDRDKVVGGVAILRVDSPSP